MQVVKTHWGHRPIYSMPQFDFLHGKAPLFLAEIRVFARGEDHARFYFICGCVVAMYQGDVTMNRPITEMSDSELLEEIERLQAIPIPKGPVAKAPRRSRDVKPKAARRGGWRDTLFGSEGGEQ